MKGGKEQQYEYLPLREAVMRKGEEVNFYAAVSEYEQPKPTRGSDIVCTMSVADMSYDSPGLRLLIFASAANCPRVRAVGDIIRVHRVEMGDFRGEPQAVAKVNRKASFVLFQGRGDARGREPYQQAHGSYSFDAHDEQRLAVMRGWIDVHPLCALASDYLVPIAGMKEGAYFDLCCRVLFVDDRAPEGSATIFYAWDGTDAPPRPLPISPNSDDAAEVAPSPALPREILQEAPPVGTILAIVPQMQLDDLPGRLPQRGDWVKFRNLACRTGAAGALEAAFTRESKLSLLSTDAQLVKQCCDLYEARVLSEDTGRLPQSSPRPPQSLTVTDFEHVGFSTLREVLAFPEPTWKFRCLVRVTATQPTAVVDFSALLGNGAGGEEYMYAIRLMLEDPTARLQAILYGPDGVQFFNGHPPVDLRVYGATVGALERKVHKLLGTRPSRDGGPPQVRDPPWIKCCLKSYYLEKAHPWETRHFRIFATTYPG